MHALEDNILTGSSTLATQQELFGQLPLRVTAMLGSARVSLAQLGALGPGAVVELEEMAGEPLLLLANGMPFAHGEVVVVNDKFGVRIASLLAPDQVAEAKMRLSR